MPRHFIPEYRRRIRENAQKHKESADKERQKAERESEHEDLATAIHAVEQELHRSSDENAPQKKSDRRWERAGIIGLWAAAIVGVVAIIMGNLDSGRQLDEMQAEQRPWIGIPSTDEGLDIKITEPLAFQKDGSGQMRTSLFLRSAGKKPAFGVRWHSKIMAIHGTRSTTEEVGEALANYCEPIRKQPPEILERTLFPRDKYLEREFPSAAYPADIASAFSDKRRKAVRIPGELEFAFIGCVDYRDGSGIHHQSRYAFLLWAPQQGGGWMGYLKPEGVHPELRLIEFLQSAD
jgi:hypothetical protein